ncbi:50S ribosomal protein L11 methyltransferase [candidate division KSB1 bacterium]|nr:50S ribosomal protein L11 methyltransferase [candidate division KSB1 bacterium]
MQARSFLQVRIRVNAEIAEAVSNFLFENGASGIAEQENELLAYFDASVREKDIVDPLNTYLSSLQQLLHTDANLTIATEILPQRDWNEEWKKSLRPIRITDNMLVQPSWLAKPIPAPPIVIEIDPEMAFGSGEHATTQLTLQLIEKNVHPDCTVLDVGTGSGILAIAALLLGAGSAVAFDTDAIAAQTARHNAIKNGVSGRLCAFAGTLDALQDRYFDLIVANVNRTQILNMLRRMAGLLDGNGLCLLSGILTEEEEMISVACHQNGLTVESIISDKEWLAFETRKR